MASGTEYGKLYNQAYAAYGQGNYDEALVLANRMEEEFPNDPHVCLLQGNIHTCLEHYELACRKYESVLEMKAQLEDQPGVIEYAYQGLDRAQQFQAQLADPDFGLAETEGILSQSPDFSSDDDFASDADFSQWEAPEDEGSWSDEFPVDGLDWDSAVFNENDMGEPTLGQSQGQAKTPSRPVMNDTEREDQTSFRAEFDDNNPFGDEELPAKSTLNWESSANSLPDFPFLEEDAIESNGLSSQESDEPTFVVSSDLRDNPLLSSPSVGKKRQNSHSAPVSPERNKATASDLPSNVADDHAWELEGNQDMTIQASPSFSENGNATDENFLDQWDALNEEDLDGISKFDLTDISQGMPDSGLFNSSSEGADFNETLDMDPSEQSFATSRASGSMGWLKTEREDHSNVSGTIDSFVVKPTVEVGQGRMSWFINADLRRKQLITSAGAGAVSAFLVLFVGGISWLTSPKTPPTVTPTSKTEQTQKPAPKTTKETTQSAQKSKTEKPKKSGSPVLLMALLSGLGGFGTTFFLLHLTTSHIKLTLNDLQAQLDAIYHNNLNVKATVYGEDEFGQLSARFNQAARQMLTTTSEAQQRAAETEQAREDLQRQVIRLLDDVEGAARGDLTVEAEVTADVLGAVADAFNLTIQNLREIVRQVKKAAKQVNKGSTDSESFARNNSSDALRMAEELAVTLNSVQMMTESIQRVAENAREAEEVAHTSSVTALRGGEAVERTVAGILQIRETVSETARKVKRLAEASQEISKIVALISQIASRTNLLALNASIQAARAGEAGKDFAIVADEVRQLADRSAKSLKEIEQIVLQIQSETGSVMQAMEEGIQQVIMLTDMSEQAKGSLEDIIEVSNRINSLVRSITADTVKQRENSRAVAQVMQSVELTAQETSQESQRVAGSLQKLVSISRDLLSSVERFRVEQEEKA